MSQFELARSYEVIWSEATRLAGGLTDLAQRATVYHHLFRASGGNHAFPLIAAHGALWAGGYFRFGMQLGKLCSWQFGRSAALRRGRRLRQLEDFANAFRDINRRVCIDTYVNFHFTARFGSHPEVTRFVPADLLEALNRVHAARLAARELPDTEKRTVFEAHFRHEQEHVVGPAISEAVAAFDWPLLRFIALRPLIRFAYFGKREFFWFRDFSHREERIERGFQAFDIAARVGWRRVEGALESYRILPAEFLAGPVEYFAAMRQAVAQSAALA